MPTAYNISNCIGWYRPGIGVYSDAGTTPANNGDGVYQWSDQSGAGNHLLQTTSANRPVYNGYATALSSAGLVNLSPFGASIDTYRAQESPGIYFDGTTSFLNLPNTTSINGAVTAILCTRGQYYSPLSFGTDGTYTLNYGWVGGSPMKMGVYNSGVRSFPVTTHLPSLLPMVHGFRASSTANETRLFMGSNQTSAIGTNYANFLMTGGALGRTLNLSAGGYGNFSFLGEIFELAIFSAPLTDGDIATLITAMQASNRLHPSSNGNQVVFIGDSLTAGGPNIPALSQCYPWLLCKQFGGSFKPFMTATPGHTIAQQQSLVTNQVIPLDKTPFTNNVAIVCAGSNDIAQGRTDTQVVTDLSALCAGLRASGYKVIVATITSRNSATGYDSTKMAYLASVNSAIVANYRTFADALVDWAGDSRLSDCTNSLYFSDQCHTTDLGDATKAALVKPALDAILNPPTTPAVLSYASFFTAGRTFAGNYGNFVRS